jgi:Putative Ig domain
MLLSFLRSKAATIAAVALFTLAACGGGGSDGPSTLVVGFDYPPSTVNGEVFRPLSVAPTVTGLQGHSATFQALDPLPVGLTINRNTGEISGVPLAKGDHLVSIQLSVSGYEGRLLSVPRITITSPFTFSYGLTYEVGLTVGQPMMPIVPHHTGLQAGDQVSYALAPASGSSTSLPPGVTFDTTTGVLSGAPTATQAATFYTVRTTITRGSYSTTLDDPTVSISVRN